MIPKFDLKVQNPAKLTLFANKAEAIIFWLSIAGLIFLAIVSFFRYLANQQMQLDVEFRKAMLLKTDQLENQNKALQSQIDSLKIELENPGMRAN